jgi:hypothetical protein
MPLMKHKAGRSLNAGTSLIELLVVIVVFLIGILAIAQIFPGGLHILATTRNNTVSNTLGHEELERERAFANSLPEQIIGLDYSLISGQLVGTVSSRSVDDLGPQGQLIEQVTHTSSPGAQLPWNDAYSGWSGSSNAPIGGGVPSWDVLNGSGDIGPVSYVSGANNVRRIVGEGGVVPGPAHIGAVYAALKTLEFGPAVWHANSTAQPTLYIYGNDLYQVQGVPAGTVVNASGTVQSTIANQDYILPGYAVPSYQYYFSESTINDPFLYIPVDQNFAHNYRITFIANISTTSGTVQRTYVVTNPINVPAMPTVVPPFPASINQGAYYAVDFGQYVTSLLNVGETLISVDLSSVRLARMFDQIAYGTAFVTSHNPDGTPQNPYQYQIPDVDPSNLDAKRDTLGMILINPTAYGYVEQTNAGQPILLRARADYDVFDWRIIKEDFKAPDTTPYQYQLALPNLKHHYGYEPDGTLFLGMGFEVPNEDGTAWDFEKRDVVVADLATGGIITKASAGGFDVNYSIGMLHFNPVLVGPKNAQVLSLYEVFPSTNSTSPVPVPISGLTLRVYYMANGEWSVQPLKAAANYQIVTASPPLSGQVYLAPPVSGSNPLSNNDPTIQFPNSDVGATVTIDQLWYDASNSAIPEVMYGQSFVVRPANAQHPVPYIALTDIDPYATGADFSNNYAVRGVKGLSLSVRVLWNPNPVTFSTTNTAGNISLFNTWEHGWRHVTTEGILQRGSIEE